MFELLILGIIIVVVMRGRQSAGFARKLKQELPRWVESGWVADDKVPLILAEVENNNARFPMASMIAILGAILLAAGAITFFAANWQAIPKGAKLVMLFGAMWADFAAAWWARVNEKGWLDEAMLLLGVLLFGANIMLVAQMYHISAHYPDGVLLWGLGGLLTGWLMRSQVVFGAALVLVLIWSGMESIDFAQLHWLFFPVWVAFTGLAVREQWLRFAHVLMLALIIWSAFAFVHGVLSEVGGWTWVYLAQLFLLAYLALWLGSLHLMLSPRWLPWGEVVQSHAAVVSLSLLWWLTFPDFLSAKLWGAWSGVASPMQSSLWMVMTLPSVAIVLGLAIWHKQRTTALGLRVAWHRWGDGLLLLLLITLLVNLWVPNGVASYMAIAFNILFFAITLWFIYVGTAVKNRQMINLGFIFFAVGLLSRYVDFFWTLLDRSLFFMVGGVLLIMVAAVLDHRRRTVLSDLKRSGA